MKRKIFSIIISIVILIEMAILVFQITKILNTKKYAEQLSLGDKYLQELDYENAELCYLAAIEINDKNVTPYVSLAQLYMETDRYDEAYEILEQAEEAAEYGDFSLVESLKENAEQKLICVYPEPEAPEEGESEESSGENGSEQSEPISAETLLLNKKSELQAAYGQISGDRFVVSIAAELQAFPTWIEGYINSVMIDLDQDEIEELLVISSRGEAEGIWAEIYGIEGDDVTLETELQVGVLHTFTDVRLDLYYNKQQGCYCIQNTSNLVGSYTGTSGFDCHLYTIKDQIEEVGSWEWNNAVYQFEELDMIEREMTEMGIQEFHNRFLEFQAVVSENHTMLAKVDVFVTSGEFPRDYTVEMELWTEEELQAYTGE